MGSIANVTPHSAAYSFGRDAAGAWEVTATIKASYTWDRSGTVREGVADAILDRDQYAGDPAVAGLARAAELGPRKKKVDVLVAGSIVFGQPITDATVALRIGSRVSKAVRVFGNRVWEPRSNTETVPSRPRPIARVPIVWERSFGGTDPEDPTNLDLRNPVGSGMARNGTAIHGRLAPNFEHAMQSVASSKERPPPVGFGPVAAHWQPRAGLAGTHDERWVKERSPLPPTDFDPAFHNLAPVDQQLPRYIPGELVVLVGMTPAGQDRFALPELRVPVHFLTKDELHEKMLEVDTIIIEPEQGRFSLLARAALTLPSSLALRQVVIGDLTRGQRAALETGKRATFTRRRHA